MGERELGIASINQRSNADATRRMNAGRGMEKRGKRREPGC